MDLDFEKVMHMIHSGIGSGGSSQAFQCQRWGVRGGAHIWHQGYMGRGQGFPKTSLEYQAC